MSVNTKHYGVGLGPQAHLMRIMRDSPSPLTTGQVYEKAVEMEVKVHSRRHMKVGRCRLTLGLPHLVSLKYENLLSNVKRCFELQPAPLHEGAAERDEEGGAVQVDLKLTLHAFNT